MQLRTSFERLLAFDHWANGQSLESLEAMREPPLQGVELMGHLLGAEVCWLSRIVHHCEPENWEWWERADVASLRRAWQEDLPARWAAFLADPAASDPARAFTYVNFLGDTAGSVVEDALLQLMFHSAYHRGQVATRVRAAGGEPAVVDFHRATRGGVIPRGA